MRGGEEEQVGKGRRAGQRAELGKLGKENLGEESSSLDL